MELPEEIRARLEQLVQGEDLLTAARRLSERYRFESGKGKRLAAEKRDIMAYAAARMPATFAAAEKALRLTLSCCNAQIRSVLDAGAGTGAAAHAAQLLTGCRDITCIEREPAMIEIGRELADSRDLGARWINRDLSEKITESADLVTCSYCLGEMTGQAREAAVKNLWNAAREILVIIEPGTPEGFSQLKRVRAVLTELGGHIAAPCPKGTGCPLPPDDWCAFAVRVARSRLQKRLKGGEAPFEDEKFCFIAASRAEITPCEARIVRRPIIESGKITLRLCRGESVGDEIITRKSPLFKAARKSVIGGEFPPENG